MDVLSDNVILEFHPDTLRVVRKEINLNKPGEIKDALAILKEWVQAQRHFKKKDFADHYLESTLIAAKGSIERAKKLLDGMCTLRTLLPKFFNSFNVRRDTYEFSKVTCPVLLPKLTKDHHRVYVAKAIGNFSTAEQYLQFYKFCALMGEYAKLHDYVANIEVVLDLAESNILKIVSVMDVVDLRHGLTILMDGFGLRIKGIHIITESKTVEALLALLKQVLKPKAVYRMHTYKSREAVCNIIGEDVLPVDLGGTERSLDTLKEEWLNVLSSEDFTRYIEDLYKGGTDETRRASVKFNEEYSGLPGTFRVLTLD
ncbi:alpha-tocopherol transfer protein-like [Zerene cesonia]|uniref:alpha-tocopherol transfer protein-like n=1 Tax=Zerene cesonia TaxID=33412 RepID=UPI0018E51715|nr:alpha-tocopherol transfer protein-like [Zerene cesonia]